MHRLDTFGMRGLIGMVRDADTWIFQLCSRLHIRNVPNPAHHATVIGRIKQISERWRSKKNGTGDHKWRWIVFFFKEMDRCGEACRVKQHRPLLWLHMGQHINKLGPTHLLSAQAAPSPPCVSVDGSLVIFFLGSFIIYTFSKIFFFIIYTVFSPVRER
jgi:hypothetical protein